jgi:peptide/nickel transport system substrate-binding protein
VLRLTAVVALAAIGLSCGHGASAANEPPTTVLRLGVSVGVAYATNPTGGIRQIAQNLTTEYLARTADDGRMEPQIAAKWALADEGRTLNVELKHGVTFQDGSPADAPTIARLLPDALKGAAGSVADDIESIRPVGTDTIAIRYRRPSPLLLESLEAVVRKSPTVSTGPFVASPSNATEFVANDHYAQGRPAIDRITIQPFPSVRSAWAEMLRSNIDMLYEVGPDALDSLENATNVSMFTFLRRYQYALVFNRASAALRSKTVRTAMNLAVDRNQEIARALNGHGLASTGPVWPKHWAADPAAPRFSFDPAAAARLMDGKTIHLKCLMPTDAIYERLALELSRQLSRIGVTLEFQALAPDDMFRAQREGDYDAVLTEIISGPTMLRLYVVWRSASGLNFASRGNATVDAALDRVRNAASDAEYRAGVAAVQRAFVDDPPAVLLAWSERARAVSRRFAVPPEAGRDVLATIRLWTPRTDQRVASRN